MPDWRTNTGFVLVCVGFVLQPTGIFSPAWGELGGNKEGLFQACPYMQSCYSLKVSAGPAYYKAIVAMELIAFIVSLAAFSITFVNFVAVLKENTRTGNLPTVSLATSIISGFFSIIGVIIYGVKIFNPVSAGYSYYLTVFGAVVLVAGGVLTFMGRGRSGSYSPIP